MTKQEYLKYYYAFDEKRQLLVEMYFRNTIASDEVRDYLGKSILDLLTLTSSYFLEDNEDREPLTDAEERWTDSVIESARYWEMEDDPAMHEMAVHMRELDHEIEVDGRELLESIRCEEFREKNESRKGEYEL